MAKSDQKKKWHSHIKLRSKNLRPTRLFFPCTISLVCMYLQSGESQQYQPAVGGEEEKAVAMEKEERKKKMRVK